MLALAVLTPCRALHAVPLPELFNQVAVVLDGPIGQRREVGGPAPSWQQEELAQQRLIKLDLMSGLLDCILIYFRLAHSDSPLGLRLMNHRKLLRCPTRPQALGRCALKTPTLATQSKG